MLKVINLVHWAGVTFSHAPGDEILLPEHIALARLEHGLVELPPSEISADELPPIQKPARRKR